MTTNRPLSLPVRFATVYFIVFNLAWTNGVPGSDWATDATFHLWLPVVRAFGKALLGLDITRAEVTGSGDTVFDYVRLIIFVGLSTIVTAVWSLARRDPMRDERLEGAARIFLRYIAGYFFLSYGVSKVLLLQMPSPHPSILYTRFADMSPMGVAWRFIGASPAYQVFCGLSECVAGALLFSRRTTTLGGLAGAAVMLNVVLLNFGYDVCVKVFSVHLFAMSIFLALPDLRRIVDLLIFRRPVLPPLPERPPGRRTRTWRMAAKSLAIAYLVVWCAYEENVEPYLELVAGASRSELYGMYDVESMVRDGKPVPPSLDEKEVWRHVGFDNRMSLWMLDETTRYYDATFDAQRGMLDVTQRGEPKATLVVGRPDPEHLTLGGVLGHSLVSVRLRRVDLGKLTLVGRGFHWVNESSFNR